MLARKREGPRGDNCPKELLSPYEDASYGPAPVQHFRSC